MSDGTQKYKVFLEGIEFQPSKGDYVIDVNEDFMTGDLEIMVRFTREAYDRLFYALGEALLKSSIWVSLKADPALSTPRGSIGFRAERRGVDG